jgi:hypothetical protein
MEISERVIDLDCVLEKIGVDGVKEFEVGSVFAVKYELSQRLKKDCYSNTIEDPRQIITLEEDILALPLEFNWYTWEIDKYRLVNPDYLFRYDKRELKEMVGVSSNLAMEFMEKYNLKSKSRTRRVLGIILKRI